MLASDYQCEIPVVFFIFNRPKQTREVWQRIQAARPKKLYLIADGPRKNSPTDNALCQEVKEIVSSPSWDGEVIEDFSELNLGCKKRIVSGISWVFEKEPIAIFLEDDCLPEPSFFPFMEELLLKFQEKPKVWMVSGINHLQKEHPSGNSYFFSKYGGIWGWGSWRNRWDKYQVDMKDFNVLEEKVNEGDSILSLKEWSSIRSDFSKVKSGDIDTWDFQWDFTRFLNRGLVIIPNKNLISNIGYGDNATHTTEENSPWDNIPTHAMEFPLKHPASIERFTNYEVSYFQKILKKKPWSFLKQKLKDLFS